MTKNLIIGVHSIAEAIKNPLRKNHVLYCTQEGLTELGTKLDLTAVEVLKLNNNQFQTKTQQILKDHKHKMNRVPGGLLLETDVLPDYNLTDIYKEIDKRAVKIIVLDRVTDVHNAGAILRTASFYGVEFVIISIKGNFGQSPSYFRIASGATEHVKIVNCASLPRAISKLSSLSVNCIGFSEHASEDVPELNKDSSCALVMGAEDIGLSNSVLRSLSQVVSFKPKGAIKSLNVSVASAVGMEKFFGPA